MITLMNNVDRTRFDPVMIVVRPDETLRPLVDRVIPVTVLGKSGSLLLSAPALLSAIHKIKPDIIVSTMAPMNFTVLLLKPFLGKIKVIVREAITPSFLLLDHPFLAPLIRAFYKTLYPLADCVISPAKKIINEFRDMLGMDTHHYVWLPNPVDSKKIRNFRPATGQHGEIHFIAAGRLHPQKGFDRLIGALKDFHPDYPWALTILGEGPERTALEHQIADNNISAHVRLAGLHEIPWPLYAAADAFLLPSRFEGLPNVVLEALACGTPVIAAAEAGGIAEIAALTPPGSVTIVESMSDFIAAMKRVVPGRHEAIRDSLLPADYALDSVVRQFESILLNQSR